MSKKTIGPQPLLDPHPTTLVGANIDGKPNFAAVAWAGIVAGNPPCLSIGLQHRRYTLKGIRQNMTFSVNIPSTDMAKETDYCGIYSGSETDKVKDCGFKVFYGNLGSAPLIEQCPVNLECEVLHMLNLGSHVAVIGKIIETHISEECLTDGKPDIKKIKPIIFTFGKYFSVGEPVADTFRIGKQMKTSS
jgi:flavin reductase (DIM6/NTAB) family NADH-FMN oxidoreductase RutF